MRHPLPQTLPSLVLPDPLEAALATDSDLHWPCAELGRPDPTLGSSLCAQNLFHEILVM